MRIISKKRLQEFGRRVPRAQKPLEIWHSLASRAAWKNFEDAKRTFGSIDTAKVASGGTVTIFDIGGNKFRLVAAVHYNRQCCYVLRVLTHEEYDRNQWKEEL